MAGPQPRKLNHMKLMYGTPDADGLLPMYNFGILKEDLRKTAAMPSLLRRCAQAIHNVYGGSEPNSCLVNVYRSGKDSAGKHQDQNGSGGGGQYDSAFALVSALAWTRLWGPAMQGRAAQSCDPTEA